MEEHESEFVGVVGERTVLTLTTKAFRFLDTDYGISTLITYHDDQGNVVRWFRSGEWEIGLEETATYDVFVKRHVEYGDGKETQINRVTPYVTPERKKELAKLRREAKLEYQRLQEKTDGLWAAMPFYGEPGHEAASLAYQSARDAASAAADAWKGI